MSARGLVRQTPEKKYQLGVGLLILGNHAAMKLQSMVQPVLQSLADRTSATVTLSTRDSNYSVTVAEAVPADQVIKISVPVGFRHPLSLGADGHALRALSEPPNSESDADPAPVSWAESRGEMQPGIAAIARGFVIRELNWHFALSAINTYSETFQFSDKYRTILDSGTRTIQKLFQTASI